MYRYFASFYLHKVVNTRGFLETTWDIGSITFDYSKEIEGDEDLTKIREHIKGKLVGEKVGMEVVIISFQLIKLVDKVS